jgi:Fe-S oxidoreductase
MCPSYQATREEQHSTRGRANALRLALTGQADLAGLTDPAVRAVLDLCLECKACKSECPTNVDMARLKAESLHQYHRQHGLPVRNRAFGHVARLSRWGSRLAPLSTWIVQSWPARWLNEQLLGIDRRRVPPAFAHRPFTRLFPALPGREGASRGQHPVLLFPDTFTNFHEPGVGVAAIEVLHRAGCAVTLGPAGLKCCGRPFISNGMLGEAIAHAAHNVELLHDWAAAGNPVIACEPSCILTIQDDYPALLRGEQRTKAETVARVCRTFEEFAESLLQEAEKRGDRLPAWHPGPSQILVQGHCHQRSLVGMGPLLRVLGRIPGAKVVDLDAGCCGLAGSFGYEKEHYELSRRVGEQRLFPALRQAPSDAAIVAPGFSCRMQIEHCLGRKVLHPAQVLRTALGEASG